MKPFSVTDAAFEGFRLARERPMVIVYWTVLWLLASLLIEYASVRLGGAAFAELVRQSQIPASERDPQELMRVYAQLFPLMAVLVPIGMVFYAVTSTAAYRLVMYRDERPPAVKLGLDEIRQLGVMVVIAAMFFGLEIVLLVIISLLTALANAVHPALGGAVGAIGFGVFLGIMVFIGVRLSLAGPLTLARRRISPLGSWALTRDHFWQLVITYVLALALALLVVFLGGLLTAAFAALLGGGLTSASALVIPESTSFAEFFTPVRIVFLLGNAAFSALTFAIASAAPAVVYQRLAPGAGEQVG